MAEETWQRADAILEAALDLPAAERSVFVAEAAGGDAKLLREAMSLLRADERAAGFLERPDLSLRQRVDAECAGLPPGAWIGPYRVVETIGSGGMGVVVRAARADGTFQRQVAIKLLQPFAGSGSARRFLRERQILASLDHPNVARLYDGGTTSEGAPFLVMELVEGLSITRYCDDRGCSIEERVELLRQVCQAVQYAHDRQVVHRDLKPNNILVTRTGEVKLLDFGIAKLLAPEGPFAASETTRISQRMLTPAYASPEQIHGAAVTVASDVYSLGVVLFELLTGTRPFQGGGSDMSELERQIVSDEPPRPSLAVTGPKKIAVWRRGLRGDLDSIVLKALHKKPTARYASVSDLAEDLRAFLDGRPVAARREERRSRAGRWWRHGAMATVAIGILTTLLGSLIPGDHGRRELGRLGRQSAETADPGSPESSVAGKQSHPAIAVLGLANLSGAPETEWVATALSEIMVSGLTAGRDLGAVPRAEIERFRHQLAAPTVERLGRADFERAFDQLGADHLILGSFLVRSDRSLIVDVRLRSRIDDEEVTLVERGHEQEVPRLGAALAAALRAHLGVSGAELTRERSGRPVHTQAAELYQQGLAELARFEPGKARDQLEQALVLEPEAPAALSALAAAWTSLGDLGRAEAVARRAYELAGDLPWDERLRIEGRYRQAIRDWPRAREIYQALRHVFPDNFDDGLRQVEIEIRGGRPARALEIVDALKARFDTGDPRLDLAEARAAHDRGLRARQRRAAARAAAAGEASGAELLAGRARMLEAVALADLGRAQEASAVGSRARDLLLARDDRLTLAWTFIVWGNAPVDLDARQARDLFRQAGDRLGEARARIRSAWKKMGSEEGLDELGDELARVLEEVRELGDRRTEAHALNRLAILHSMLDDMHRSTALFREASGAARASGDLKLLAGILGNLAHHMTGLGEAEGAREALEETIVLARRTGDRAVLVKALAKSGANLRRLGELAQAETRLLEAEQIARSMGSKGLRGVAAWFLGALYQDMDAGKARRWLTLAVESFGEGVDKLFCELLLVDLLIAEQRLAEAESRLRLIDPAHTSEERFAITEASLRVEQRRYDEAARILAAHEAGQWMGVEGRHRRRYLKARIDAAAGNTADALAAARGLVDEARRLGHLSTELNADLRWGLVLMEVGDVTAGRTELSAVMERARALGLHALADRAQGRLEAYGI